MRLIICFWLLVFNFSVLIASDFIRELPSKELLEKLDPEKLKNIDAVVILKEQSYTIDPYIFYGSERINSPATTYSRIIIVRVFNETAVRRYITVEFEYPGWHKLEPVNT